MLVDDSSMYSDLAAQITTLLSRCSDLRSLRLFMVNTHFSGMLRDSHFPNLRTFRYAVAPDVFAALPAFINRHRNITTLELDCYYDEDFRLDDTWLPTLTRFYGDSLFLRSLTCNQTLQNVSIEFFDHDFEPALERLTSIAYAKLELVVVADCIDTPAFLGYVAMAVPRITSLTFRKLDPSAPAPDHLIFGDICEIETHLKILRSLRVLEFCHFDPDETGDSTKLMMIRAVDKSIIEMWSVACPSLVSIFWNGQRWKHIGTAWGMDYSS
ncbi:hypothetical protein MVEN_01137300 [Mycena venus]|uniref:F-box domain-containing protein n=1 Tax=Mycena venus TaxID=2733690 RepID=A0A8H6Y982_9AGAR|nr:hypothetical protein MVEN_01137300 [Mycena venus]